MGPGAQWWKGCRECREEWRVAGFRPGKPPVSFSNEANYLKSLTTILDPHIIYENYLASCAHLINIDYLKFYDIIMENRSHIKV